MPSLPKNEERTVNEVPHSVYLAPECWVLLLSAFEFLDDLAHWSGAGDELTPTEIDTIQDIVARAYEQLMLNQVGSIQWLAGACPENMLVCDGSTYLRIDYPSLYDYLDAVYIVDSSSFVVPDMRDKVPLGVSSSRANGDTGGAETVTLVTSEMPSHDHAPYTDAGHTHAEGIAAPSVALVGAIPSAVPAIGATGLGFANITATSAGGDGAHDNMQPWLALLPCIVAL